VEELLRQLKNKMEGDIGEIYVQVQNMHETRNLLMNIQSYQQVLQA
jgi:uncharacterized protein with ACT and thioredoxin-like domain